MIKAALEKVINEDMAEIWARLNSEERRLVVENMEVHTFKKNQLIYAEGDEPEFLWVLEFLSVLPAKVILIVCIGHLLACCQVGP